MKTHYAEENDEVISSNDTADDHCWREHQIKSPQLFGDLMIAAAVLAGLTLSGLLLSPTPSPVTMSDTAATAQLPQAFVLRGALPRGRPTDDDDDR